MNTCLPIGRKAKKDLEIFQNNKNVFQFMKRKIVKEILNDNTKTWNKIASEFDLTRKTNWPELSDLKEYVEPGMKVLDLGCGNGRLFELLKDSQIDYTGIDNSKKLIGLARTKYTNQKLLTGDALNLPFEDNSFDLIYSVAVLHVIPSKEMRLLFLQEAQRVLKKDGKIVLTVWNLWQRKYSSRVVKSSLLKIIGKSKLDFGDLYIPWQNKYQRYHHAITKRELKTLFKRAGFNIKTIKYLNRNKKKVNILVVARKTASYCSIKKTCPELTKGLTKT
jgi:ubiquinone/menaquinone biosynthesis C-methylase UbiE